MTTRASNDLDRLAGQIRELSNAVRDLQRPQAIRIPILNVDPPTTDPTNIWLLADGRLRSRHLNPAGTGYVIREWVSTTAGSSTSGVAPAPAPSAPTTRTTSWAATWSQSYRQAGAQRTDQGAIYCYYGYVDSFNGRNRSLVGFDYASIASTLAGSTVMGVWLRMVNLHSYWNNGSDIHLGIHNFTSKPGTWSGGGIPYSMYTKVHYGKPQDKTVQLPLLFATSIRDGIGKGIALESPSNSLDFYGYVAGVGSGYVVPTLTVQYAK